MGEYAPRRNLDCFNMIIKNLLLTPKPIIVDEIDYLMFDSKSDIKTIIDELSEIEFTDCVLKDLYRNVNRFRQIVKILNKAENFAKSNGLNFVIVPPAITSKIPRTAIGANWSLSVSTSQTPNKYLNST